MNGMVILHNRQLAKEAADEIKRLREELDMMIVSNQWCGFCQDYTQHRTYTDPTHSDETDCMQCLEDIKERKRMVNEIKRLTAENDLLKKEKELQELTESIKSLPKRSNQNP